MNVCRSFITIFNLLTVSGDNYKTVSDQFYSDPRKPALFAKEGVKVTLKCFRSNVNDNYAITFANSKNLTSSTKLVDSSDMSYISNTYGFSEKNGRMFVFTINQISREDDGLYRCVNARSFDVTTRSVTVIYSPSEKSPQCSSNYNSHAIFFNEMKEYFIFNCSTERGNPPVFTNIYVNEEEVTSGLKIINETRTDNENNPMQVTTYSLLQNFNDTFQGYNFVCNVTQNFSSRNYHDYQGNCSFGPLHLLSGFSLSVSPSNVTVRDESKVTVTCISNITGVEITWNTSEEYIVTNHNGWSVLTILSFKPPHNGTIFVECIGTYGSRTITKNTTLVLMISAEEDENENNEEQSSTYIVVAVVIIVSCAFVTLLSIIVFSCWKGKKGKEKATNASSVYAVANPSMSNQHIQDALTTTEETNMNSNNTSACPVMSKNVIYEPASFKNTTTECRKDNRILGGKNRDPLHEIRKYDLGDDHLICENVIYQPF